jgi:hypothetical protein
MVLLGCLNRLVGKVLKIFDPALPGNGVEAACGWAGELDDHHRTAAEVVVADVFCRYFNSRGWPGDCGHGSFLRERFQASTLNQHS